MNDTNRIAGVVFDKDGTLFDFAASWSGMIADLLDDLSDGDDALRARLGRAIGFDPQTRQFSRDSPVIAAPTAPVAALLAAELSNVDAAALTCRMDRLAAGTPQVPVGDLVALMGALGGSGLRLGVVTNDGIAPARSHLAAAGIADLIDPVLGADSGFGAKPEPGQLQEVARLWALPPTRIAMVGDSQHDLQAARAAGMFAVGVLTGIARRGDLAPFADVVLADISGLQDWLGR